MSDPTTGRAVGVTTRRPTGGGRVLQAVADAVLVLLFAAVGRASHGESHPVTDVLVTAWPFLLGAAVGWALVLGRGGRPEALRGGVVVVLAAVVVGMVLRVLTGRGTAVAFVIVATVVLGAFLLGARLVAARVRR